jgi:hypothetical protein
MTQIVTVCLANYDQIIIYVALSKAVGCVAAFLFILFCSFSSNFRITIQIMSSTFHDITRDTPLDHYLIVYLIRWKSFSVIRRQWLLSDTQAYDIKAKKSMNALENHVDYGIGRPKDWGIFQISVNIMKSDGGICVPLIYDNLTAALQGYRDIWTNENIPFAIREGRNSVVNKQKRDASVTCMQVNWITFI